MKDNNTPMNIVKKAKMKKFYIMSFLFFQPLGLYSIFKNGISNKLIKYLMVILFGYSSFWSTTTTFKLLFNGKIFSFIFLLFIQFILLGMVYDYYLKYLNWDDVLDSGIVIEPNQETSKRDTNNYNNSNIHNNESIRQYIGTGEVCTFHYMGSNDCEYRERNIIINDVYDNNGYTYIDAYDLDVEDNRCFRTDRIM